MTITVEEGEISEAEIPLLNDVVPGSVDFRGRDSVRSKSGCWKSASFIIASGVAERFAYYGISSNMVSYLTGSMGQPTATAAATLNAWFGTVSVICYAVHCRSESLGNAMQQHTYTFFSFFTLCTVVHHIFYV